VLSVASQHTIVILAAEHGADSLDGMSEIKNGQTVSWDLGSFGFREAIRNGDDDARAALQLAVEKVFCGLQVFNNCAGPGDFQYCDDGGVFGSLEEQIASTAEAVENEIIEQADDDRKQAAEDLAEEATRRAEDAAAAAKARKRKAAQAGKS
jgi:hypothetical protein